MNILIDTNIVISLEPTSPDNLEPRAEVAASFVRVAHEGGDHLLLHPASLDELAGDADPVRRDMRDILLAKYERLEPAPPMAPAVVDELGGVDPGSHNHVDHLMLSAIIANAATYLVTDDGRIHKKAARLGIAERVFTVEDALAILTTLLRRTPEPPPLVQPTQSYDLDLADPIFDSFREEYEGFDEWFIRCQQDHRRGWVIRDEDSTLAAVCIFKEEDDELQLGGPTLKVCSLKVSEARAGRRYGELLLKTLFGYLHENDYAFAFLTVHEHHEGLISLIEDFGFVRREPDKPVTGERYYVKSLAPSADEVAGMSPLNVHIMFGPPALKIEHAYLVPIQPAYHRLLFPDAEPQDEPQQLELDLDTVSALEPKPFGNALRKAYLCHTNSRQLVPGSTILFYRSWDTQAVTAVGVVEETYASSDAIEVAEFVGQRSVYSLEEIQDLCEKGEVLAIRFRQDRLLTVPISLIEMVEEGLAKRHPQSVQSTPAEVTSWLVDRIGA